MTEVEFAEEKSHPYRFGDCDCYGYFYIPVFSAKKLQSSFKVTTLFFLQDKLSLVQKSFTFPSQRLTLLSKQNAAVNKE